MAKGSALAIFALIIAIGGVGLGGYLIFTQLTQQGVHRTYYDERTTAYTSGMEDSWYDIPDISISFQVDAGESVYFMFTCRANLIASSALVYMHFVLKIDDIRIIQSQVSVGHNEGATINTMSFSVALTPTIASAAKLSSIACSYASLSSFLT